MKSNWQAIAALDLMSGRCVRLRKGKKNDVTYYDESPLSLARRYEKAGASRLHLVDLDGAFGENLTQISAIADLAKNTSLELQVGGGIRSRADIRRLKDLGISRFILGSLALSDTKTTLNIIEEFGKDSIILAFDFSFHEGRLGIASRAWQDLDFEALHRLVQAYSALDELTLLCTHIEKDGTLEGISLEPYQKLREHFPKQRILASGGVKGMSDLKRLETLGLDGVVVGKALLEGHIDERSLWSC